MLAVADGPAAAGPDPAGAGSHGGRDGSRRRGRDRGGRAGSTGRRAGLAGGRQRPPPACRRSCAHRLRVAVAGARDDPQVRPDVLLDGRPDGRAPGVRLRLFVGPAVRLDQGLLPRTLRPHPGQGRRGSVRPGRRHVGRVGHQHAGRRGDGAAVRRREALLPRGVRGRLRRGVAAGFVRLLGRAAADRRGRRRPLLPHPEDLLESDQPHAAPHLLVAGHRRHPGVHPFPAGRHLQLAAGARPS